MSVFQVCQTQTWSTFREMLGANNVGHAFVKSFVLDQQNKNTPPDKATL
jgi:hypothetical protein